jgi:hypothetical protein
MTDTTTAKLITQLRMLQALTNTEAQIAQTRQVQARDQAVRDELATNAANAHDRAQLIAAALRDLGGVPDVVTPALGRATALAKTVVEQGQPIAAALFGDLALEHQLLDRAGYLEALAATAGNLDIQNLARRLQAAHQQTLEWITSVLEEASGKPTKVRATPVQKAVGGLSSVVNYPSRRTAEWINGTAEVVVRTRSRVGTVAAAAVDSLTAGRDAALLEAEQIATRKGARSTETALHRTRVLAGGLIEDELPVDNYDDLTVGEVASALQKLTDTPALTALVRYEQNHKDRAGAVTAIENRLSALAEQDISRN